MSDTHHESHDDPYTLNVGPGPFPLSIHHDPFLSRKSRADKRVEQNVAGRRIVRALPVPSNVLLIGLVVAAAANSSNGLLLGAAFAYALYCVAVSVASVVFDPECTVPTHRNCPACGDLPPLMSSLFQRLTRKATSR